MEPVQRQAPLSEPTYNLYPTLPQELSLSRIRNINQNQNTVEINRQIIHPRRNRNFQTPRVHFDIPQSPSPITPENPNFRPNISQSPIQHIMTHHSQDDKTYEQIIEQPHTTAFQSQNYHFF